MLPRRALKYWVHCLGVVLTVVLTVPQYPRSPYGHRTAPPPHPKADESPPAKAAGARPRATTLKRLSSAYDALPLRFEPNFGQTDARVGFLAHGPGYTLYLTGDEAVFSLRGANQQATVHSAQPQNSRNSKHETRNSVLSGLLSPPGASPAAGQSRSPNPEFPNPEVFRMKLVGANRAAKAMALDELAGKVNYFLGNDPAKWRTNVPTYAKVKYRSVYPGIDLVYYGNQRELEYDFVVALGADPHVITIELESGNSTLETRNSKMKITANGDLVIEMPGGEVRFHKPVVYQSKSTLNSRQFTGKNGGDSEFGTQNSEFLDSRYILTGDNRIHFEIPKYDKTRPLVIDPVLTYSTYLGGSSFDQANGIAIDSSGNVYVAGFTQSNPFPTTSGAFQTTYAGNSDVFVSKLNANGTALVYSTYLGGGAVDQALAIAVDSSGSTYITGQTFQSTTMYPATAGAFQTTYMGFGDAFVTKLSPDGSSLVYSTFLGGSGLDEGRAIAVDSQGNAYVAGMTCSINFPTLGAIQSANKGQNDAFVAELNPTGSALVYSTYLGGSGYDVAKAIAVDSAGDAFVTGATNSPDYPLSNALQSACASCPADDAFVTEIGPDGGGLVYSTFLGGNQDDQGLGIAVDGQGNAYVTGQTFSANFPVSSGAFQNSLLGGSSAFVTAIAAGGSGLVYSTYLGSDSYTTGRAIAVLNGNAYVAGITHANSLPVLNPIQSTRAGYTDAFVSELNSTGSALYFSTYLGGSDFDEAMGMALDSLGDAYLAGHTRSTNFPLKGALQSTYGGGDSDAFVTEIHISPITLSTTALTFANQNVGTTSGGKGVNVTNNGKLNLTISSVTITGADSTDFLEKNNCVGTSLGPGKSCSVQVSFAPTATGTLTASLNIAADSSGSPPQTVSLTGTGVSPVVVLSPTSLSFGDQLLGTTSPAQTVTLSNTGTATLNNLGISITGTNANQFQQSNNCGTSVAVGASCTISVTFKPTITGPLAASVTIKDNASDSPQSVPLSGTGVSSQVNLSPGTVTFGAQQVGTTSAPQTVTLSNPTSSTVTVSSIAISGGNNTSFAQNNNCGSTLAPGASCTISVTFTPTTTGTLNSTLEATDNAAGSPQKTTLTGTGAVAAVSVSPSSLNFGVQAVNTTSAPQAVTLSNSGSTTLGNIKVSITGTDTNQFAQSNNCGTSIPGGASCTINVTFKPTVVASLSATLTIEDDAVNSPQTVPLSGSGVNPGGYLSPTSLSFASQPVGTASAAQSVTLTYASGSGSMTISGISITGTNATDFSQTNNCGSSLAAGASCTINVTFTPTATGTRTATLAVTDDAANSPQTASLTGTGASSTAAVTLSPSSLAFASQNVGTTSTAQPVTISNTGNASLSISSIAITGTNSGDFAETNNCGTSLAAGANCTINVTFTSTATGTRTATLAVSDNASGSPQTVSLSGTGTTTTSSSLTEVQVQNNIDTTTTAYTSFSVPITTTAGDLLVAFARESSNGTDNFTITDSAGQTWTQTASGYKNESSSGPRIGMFYIADSAAVTRVTVNYTTSGGVIKPGIMVMEISGAATSAVADGSVNNGTASSTTTSTSGALTTTNASDILIFATDTSGNESGWTAGTGFTIPNNKVTTGASGSNVRMAMQYAITAGALTNTTTSMTYANANWNGNIFAAFK